MSRWFILESKIKSLFASFRNMKHKERLLVIACVFGVLLILLSEFIPSDSSSKKSENVDYQQYIASLEEKSENIISSIDGVGKCKVMITLQETDENFYAQNTDESTDSGSISKKSEYVLYEDNNNDSPVLVKQSFPKVMGVAVVCQGGDNANVKEKVISAVSSLYGISSAKISVSKINR